MRKLLIALSFFLPIFSEEKTSTHSIQIGQKSLFYSAVVDSGDVSYIAYIKEGENRPITFAFNGGPGSSSIWLHMGTFGPRRLIAHEEGQYLTPPYQLIDNEETLLDLTDLVFIDPTGTGFSNPKNEESKNNPYSIRGDIESVGKFIRDYLTKNRRWNSPKYIAGESYGAIRLAGLSDYLQNEFGIYLNGAIYISPAIDLQTLVFEPDNPLPFFLFFPSYVTTAWYHGKYRPEATVEEVAQEARDFIYTTYAPSLICRRCYDYEPICKRIAEMTGLPIDVVRRQQGKITDNTYLTELLASSRKVVGRFDSRCTGFAAGNFQNYQDPSSSTIEGIFAGAFHEYLHKELGATSSYTLLSYEANGQWDFWDYNRWGYPNLMNGVRNSLIVNPNMKIFVASGYFDLATPFAATEYSFDHLDLPDATVQMEYYEGGHMFYLNPKARIKFKQDLIKFYGKNP